MEMTQTRQKIQNHESTLPIEWVGTPFIDGLQHFTPPLDLCIE